MDKDKLNLANRIISTQGELIDSFDKWVQLVKVNDLEGAFKVKTLADELRIKVKTLKKELEKLNKKSGIILLNNKLN